MAQDDGERAAGSELREADDREKVVLAYLIIIVLVGKGQREHPLFLEVGLMNAGETLGQNHPHAQEPRLHSRMFTAAALAVVVFGHDDARQPLLLVVFGGGGDGFVVAVQPVFHTARLTVERVDRTHEQIVGDVFEVAAKLEPRPGHRDVVGGTLALHLDEQRHVEEVVPVPRGEGREPLQAVGTLGDDHLHIAPVGRGRHEETLPLQVGHDALGRGMARGCKPTGWEVEALGLVEHHAAPLAVGERVGGGIEVQPAGNGQCRGELRTADEGVGVGIAVGPSAEVAVERCHDGILALVVIGVPLPLAYAGPAGIGHDDGPHALEVVEQSVALGRVAYLFRPGIDDELPLHPDALLHHLPGDGCRAGEVLVARVGAGAYEAHLHRHGIVGGRPLGPHLADGRGHIGRERPVEVGLHLREVYLHELVVESGGVGIYLLVGPQLVGVAGREGRHLGAPRLAQIFVGSLVVGKQAARGSQFGAHVADGGLARGREGGRSLTEIFEYGVGAALHGEPSQDFEYHVFGRGPPREPAREMHADEPGHLQFPRHTCEHIHGIGTAHAHGHHAQSAGIGRVGVGAHHHAAGERIVFEHHLMDDAGSGGPEADAVFARHRLQEVVHLAVGLTRRGQVAPGPHIGPYQVVAMHGCRHGHLRLACVHKLQQRHLRRGVLHGHAVGAEVDIFFTSFIWPQLCGIEKVGHEHFLRIGERPLEHCSRLRHAVGIGSIEASDHFNVKNHLIHAFNVLLGRS